MQKTMKRSRRDERDVRAARLLFQPEQKSRDALPILYWILTETMLVAGLLVALQTAMQGERPLTRHAFPIYA